MKKVGFDPKSKKFQLWDERRDLIIPGNKEETISYAARHFVEIAQKAISEEDKFTAALSGGTTPKAIYEKICTEYKNQLNWSKVWLFFSDERGVPPSDPESNYHMAMAAGFSKMDIPKHQIFRMKAENEILQHAEEYERNIEKYVGPDLFDLVMLGVGEDGHTASIFPGTDAIHVVEKAVTANFVPQKNGWRMTLTFDCINNSTHVCVYALGAAKKDIVKRILLPPLGESILPAELIGTVDQKALWILDKDAASAISAELSK